MASLAEKYVNDHRNPIVKVELFGCKLFLPLQRDEARCSDTCLSRIENILRHDRVDRRCARNVAKWSPQQNNAIVIKRVGSCLANYGHENKDGKFLDPEEMLMLLETNKLEIFHNDIPLSIQETYKIVLRNLHIGLKEFVAYKKLALQGYRLKTLKACSEDGTENVKRKSCQDAEEPATKMPKTENLTSSKTSNIFTKLKENGPQLYQCERIPTQAEYFVKSPSNLRKTEEFKLVINSVTGKFSSSSFKEENVYALCSDSDVAYYKFFNSNIPLLEK